MTTRTRRQKRSEIAKIDVKVSAKFCAFFLVNGAATDNHAHINKKKHKNDQGCEHKKKRIRGIENMRSANLAEGTVVDFASQIVRAFKHQASQEDELKWDAR